MKPILFNRFTDRDVLNAISIKHLLQFFDQFKAGLREKHLPLPHAPPGTEGYVDAWIALLKSPETLPEPLVEAVLAIEAMADPEKRPLLEAVTKEAQVGCPWLDPKDSPECLALQLWLLSPYGRPKERDPAAADSFSPRPSDGRGIKGEGEVEGRGNGDAGSATFSSEVAHVSSNESLAADSASPEPDGSLAHSLGEGSRVSEAVPGIGAQTWDAMEPAEPTTGYQSRPENPPAGPSFQPEAVPTVTPTLPPPSPVHCFHRHTGKVARLSNELREQVNGMMHDGVPYAAISEKLGEAGKHLKPYHLTRWRKRGYQEWLKEQERRDVARAKEQFALDILHGKDGGKVHEASLHIAAAQLCQFLADFDPATLKQKLEADPLNFVRLLNVLPKLSESGIKCESHRLEMGERQAKLEKDQIPLADRGIPPETLHRIEEMLRSR